MWEGADDADRDDDEVIVLDDGGTVRFVPLASALKGGFWFWLQSIEEPLSAEGDCDFIVVEDTVVSMSFEEFLLSSTKEAEVSFFA